MGDPYDPQRPSVPKCAGSDWPFCCTASFLVCSLRRAKFPIIYPALHLAKLIGQTTVVKEQVTTSSNRFGGLSHLSKTLHTVQRLLLTPNPCNEYSYCS